MTKLILSLIMSTLILIFTAIWTAVKQPGKSGKELVVVSEIPETFIMGGMLIAICYLLLISKIADPAVAGKDEASYNFAAALAVLSAISGCLIILFTFVKKVIAYPEKFVVISLTGSRKEYAWNSVTEVKAVPFSLRAVFRMDNESASINGRAEEYGKFISIAQKNIPPVIGSDVLGDLYRRITRQGILKL